MSAPETPPTTMQPTEEQRAAIEAPEVPVRVIAGAGSGKTSVMAKRIETLVARGRRPDEILGLTFSNKAAENLRRRVADEVGGGIDVLVSTYHGFGASIVQEAAEALGFDRVPTLIDRASAFQLLYGGLDHVMLEKRKVGRVAQLAAAALRLGSQCADHLVPIEHVIADCDRIADDESFPERVRDAARGRRDLARLAQHFESVKTERGFIDFGDQIALAVRALQLDPSRAEALRERHPVVLLDEYQDTNFAQRRLLELIYPKGSPITVVGDDMQSIYAFRGSHLRNLFDFADHFGTDDGTGVRQVVEAALTTNFRSGPQIVAVANAVHASVSTAKKKTLVAREHAPLATVETIVCADELAEAEQIASWVEARGLPWSETIVLGRKRRIFPLIAQALGARGIPTEIVGLGGLLSRPEILDVLAWLEVLTLDDADVATIRLLQSPLRNVSMPDLAVLAAHARDTARRRSPDEHHPRMQLLDALVDVDGVAGLSAEAWQRVKTMLADRERLQLRRDDLALPDLIEAVIDTERLRDRVDDVGAENLLRLLDVAERFLPLDGAPSVRSFLDYLQLVIDGEDEPAEAVANATDAVRVMSIHQAKGLEYDNVVVAGLAGSKKQSSIFPDERLSENGATQMEVLPLWLREDDDGFTDAPRTKTELDAHKRHADDLRADEERRLLYVALTRAKHHLLCSAAHWYSGPADPQGPSVFYELIAAQHEHVTDLGRAEPATQNPSTERRRRLAEAQRRERSAAAADAATVTAGAGSRRRGRAGRGQTSMFDANDVTATEGARTAEVPAVLSVSSLVTFAQCPRRFEWSVMTPLPRRYGGAASLGTEVHARIEVLAAGGRPIDLAEDVADGLRDDDPAGSPTGGATADGLVRSFERSPWGAHRVAAVEAPFAIRLGESIVRGRVDARYEIDGHTHVVDFKTGRQPDGRDGGRSTQLDVYGLVAVEQWGVDPDRLSTSYVYLRSGEPAIDVTTRWSPSHAADVRGSLLAVERRLRAARFDPTPGPWCRGCDFAAACPAAPDPQG